MSTTSRKTLASAYLFLGLLLFEGCHHSPQTWITTPPQNAAAPLPYDVVTDNTNSMGVTLNPKWGLQAAPSKNVGDAPPCPGTPYDSGCTHQPVVKDPAILPMLAICSLGATNPDFIGHADWSVAEYRGAIGWENYAADLDYNFRLVTDKLIGTTPENPESIEMEMDSRELFDNFGDTRDWWWEKFALTADTMNFQELDGQIHPSNPAKLACGTAIGIFNLDCEHGCRSEIHPLYTLAVQLDENPKSNDWAVLVRNWGNGGSCASYDDRLQLQDISLLLPVNAPAAPVKVAVQEFVGTGGVGCPATSYDSSRKGEVLRFALPPPERHGMAVMKVHMEWPDGAKTMSCPDVNVQAQQARIAAEAAKPPEKTNSEARLRSLMQAVGLEQNPPQMRPLMMQPTEKKLLNVVADCSTEAGKPQQQRAAAVHRAPLTVDTVTQKNNQKLVQRICEKYASTNTLLPPDLSKACDWIMQHP